MQKRGFLYQSVHLEELDSLLLKGKMSGYIGFDCTAESLHIGSLLSLMMLRWFQNTGNAPILLLGEATTLLGDPSGHDKTRSLLDEKTITHNRLRLEEQLNRFFSSVLMVNNKDWLNDKGYLTFLRDFGYGFSVNKMLTLHSVQERLKREQQLSFLEFNYVLLQAYDFVELYRRYNCRLQMGGADQWGNIVFGVEMGRRIEKASLYAFTSPLVTTADGSKMGKTQKGAVWLQRDLVSPYDYWQYWRNVDDEDVLRFLLLFTELDISECQRLGSLKGAELNEGKKRLAHEATALLHGREAACQAARDAATLFEKKEGDTSTMVPIDKNTLEKGISILEVLRLAALVDSNSKGRTLIQGGGVRLNDVVVSAFTHTVSLGDFTHQKAKLSVGKKQHKVLLAS